MKRYIKVYIIAFSILLTSCGSLLNPTIPVTNDIQFTVNLLDRSNDTFKVTVIPPSLGEENDIFNFAATAPNTYQIMDIGKYVTSFRAFDKHGNEIATKHISTNQFKILKPHKVIRIEYEISETWDSPVDQNLINLRFGTSIENDHALINGQAVFGYFKGKKKTPIKLQLQHPAEWQVATSLKKSSNGKYQAKNFSQIVDCPILLGYLTRESVTVQGAVIDIFSYSKTGMITASQIMESMKKMFETAGNYIEGIPVDQYTFLFIFEDKTDGSWAHNRSSGYVYRETEWKNIEKEILDLAAHEFFHIVTPLNIHSDIVSKFQYDSPLPSKHLWLYEGVTEWASKMMMFRGDETTADEYLSELEKKVYISKNLYNNHYSLLDLALTAYTADGQKQFGNIYMKGALVASLLDIKLIELSKGNTGLMDVIIKLSRKYGPNKSFNEDSFFTDFAEETYPEINDFFDNYIIHAEPLPLQEYYFKIGILYDESTNKFTVLKEPSEEQLKLRNKWFEPLRKRGISLFLPQTSYINYVGTMDSTIESLYEVISGERGQERNWEFFKYLFKPDAKLIPSAKAQDSTYKVRYISPNDYVKSAETWMMDNGFFEKEINRVVNTYGNMAQVFSTYETFRTQTDVIPFMRGINSIQLLFDGKRWWIVNIYWTQETPENPIPPEYLPRIN